MNVFKYPGSPRNLPEVNQIDFKDDGVTIVSEVRIARGTAVTRNGYTHEGWTPKHTHRNHSSQHTHRGWVSGHTHRR
jgi:Tfp pilus assembly protein FimT